MRQASAKLQKPVAFYTIKPLISFLSVKFSSLTLPPGVDRWSAALQNDNTANLSF